MIRLLALIAVCISISFIAPEGRAANAAASGPIKNEQQWIVDSIGRDVTQMVLFAASRSGTSVDFDSLHYETVEASTEPDYIYNVTYLVGGQSQSRSIKLQDYVWNPGNYATMAAESLKKLNLSRKEAHSKAPDDTTKLLSDCTSKSICSLNKRLSTDLTATPLDPILHEQAALLCSTMALKECAARFSDVRPWLNRVTAHLALSRALRHNSTCSNDGRLAEIILQSLGGRGAQALSLLKATAFDQSDPTLRSWLRAVRIRVTHDFRIADLEHAAPVETLEYGRALAQDISADAVTDFLHKREGNSEQEQDKGPNVDWIRIAFSGKETVASGQLYAQSAPDKEIADLSTDLQRYYPDKTAGKRQDLLRELDLAPTGAILKDVDWKLNVISWPDLAAFHCRHLLNSVSQKYYYEQHYQHMLDQAKRTVEDGENTFGTLRLFPLCKIDIVAETLDDITRLSKPADAKLTDALAVLIESHPQQINAAIWERSLRMAVDKSKIPDPFQWFMPALPFGTAFDYENRAVFAKADMDRLEEFREFEPYNTALLLNIARARYGVWAKGDQIILTFGEVANYNMTIMKLIGDAYKYEPKKQIPWLEKAAHFDPKMYFYLAEYLQASDPEKARAAFEKGLELGTNDVLKSNKCYWLVQYYLDHGDNAKAQKWAQFAGAVDSAIGLSTLGYFYERTGNFDRAVQTYTKEEEEYEGKQDLGLFYVRHADHSARYQLLADELYKKYFKHSMAQISPQDMQAPPKTGVRIKEDSQLSRQFGLNIGVIVVAVDGCRCRSTGEFYFLRNIHHQSKKIELVFWDGRKYQTIKGSPPNREFDFLIDNFSK